MKTSTKIIATIGVLAMSHLANADPITDTYSTGDVLTVTTLENIKSAVNSNDAKTVSNDSRINALETSLAATEVLVSSLQATIVSLETQNSGLSGSDLTGSTYCFINYGSELIGGGAPGVYTSHVNAVLTFTSSTQVTLSNRTNVDSFLNTSTSVIDSASTSVDPIGAFSYSLNANTLTITGINDGGFSNLYHLTLDGNVLIGDNSRLDGADHGADFTIAVRANSCN